MVVAWQGFVKFVVPAVLVVVPATLVVGGRSLVETWSEVVGKLVMRWMMIVVLGEVKGEFCCCIV